MQNQQHQTETQKTQYFVARADKKTWHKNDDQKTEENTSHVVER